ncbi:jg12090 [Pararge aegeria aegeria]|uniref:Jg12090 protein n=1 Tax=Pararge aegeria aegeria TaxID=348720 RepID=A0A8S4QNS6_9NEOP|nr:jg12090 [Pararge aegeria aegeria]
MRKYVSSVKFSVYHLTTPRTTYIIKLSSSDLSRAAELILILDKLKTLISRLPLKCLLLDAITYQKLS